MATEHSLACVGLKDDFEMLLSEIGEHDCNTFAHSFHQLDFDIQHCTKINITYFVVGKSRSAFVDAHILISARYQNLLTVEWHDWVLFRDETGNGNDF